MLKATTKVSHLAFSNSLKSKWREQISCIHTSSIFNRISGLPKGMYKFPESQADFETSTAEWEFVERLLPMKYIPKPNVKPGTVTPSGWIAPSAKKDDYPYFVTRNRDHLLRIYLNNDLILQRILTCLKGIEGDVFALGQELKDHLFQITKKDTLSVRVHEPHGVIIIRGDFVNIVKDFLHKKGF